MPNRIPALAIAALAGIVAACGSDTDRSTTSPPASNIVTFTAAMSSSKENPANSSQGTGTFLATLDTVTGVFTYDVAFQGDDIERHPRSHSRPGVRNRQRQPDPQLRNSAGCGVHHRRPFGHGAWCHHAQRGQPAHRDDQRGFVEEAAAVGLTYVNIHTSQNGGGEIRSQLTK